MKTLCVLLSILNANNILLFCCNITLIRFKNPMSWNNWNQTKWYYYKSYHYLITDSADVAKGPSLKNLRPINDKFLTLKNMSS